MFKVFLTNWKKIAAANEIRHFPFMKNKALR